MAGKIRTLERCAVCHGKYLDVLHPITGDQIDIMCTACKTRPRFFYVDGRGIRDRRGAVGRLFKDRNGKKFDSFLAAHRVLEAIRREIDEHKFDSTRWAETWKQEHRLSVEADRWITALYQDRSRTYAKHSDRFLKNYILKILGDVDVRDIRGTDVEVLYRKLREMPNPKYPGRPLEPKTIKSIMTTLQVLMGRLERLEVIHKAPPFPIIHVPRKERGWITRGNQERILAHIPERFRLVFEVMVETGIRPGEATALKVRDLVDGGIYIERALNETRTVKETKTGVAFHKRVSDSLWPRLRAATRDKLPEAWLFTTPEGRPYFARYLSRIWKRAADAAGMPIPLYVATRHSRVTQRRVELERKMGVDLAAELGHSTPRTTIGHYVQSCQRMSKSEDNNL